MEGRGRDDEYIGKGTMLKEEEEDFDSYFSYVRLSCSSLRVQGGGRSGAGPTAANSLTLDQAFVA